MFAIYNSVHTNKKLRGVCSMEKGIKIVTIGGGSSYTPELVEGLVKRYNELPVRELWLVDIEEGKEKLRIVGNLAKRMIKKSRSTNGNTFNIR